MSRRLVPIVLLVLLVSLAATAAPLRRKAQRGPTPPPSPAVPAAGQPLPNLTQAQRDAFADGLADFASQEEVIDGLGPIFNERSCATCHSAPVVGGGSARAVTRFGRRTNNIFDALANLGGSLVQDHAIGPADGSSHTFRPEVVPATANVTTRRRTTPLFGLGLVDATPDADFIALAAAQAARRDGTAGRAPLVDNIRAGMKTVGKFGWKGQVPTLFQFAGDAYVNEMGITTPDFPNESCPQGNCAELSFNPLPGLNDDGNGPILLTNYMTMLAAPPRGPQNRDTTDGEATFNQLGCNTCHVATQRSGASNIAALNRQTYHPYSDFLLHDMGALGDGIEQGAANAREMRTAPLWGLRFVQRYLHDGRATTVEQAILAHDGQARGARDRYAALAATAKTKVLAFLNSL
ncbi:MAG TPA: di-heme oxidoredictase family protein [Thermoanaerobaculia bacterium]|nr:di-heme oxidoredictase family protein [Thermoanaerobaculia bacterium]